MTKQLTLGALVMAMALPAAFAKNITVYDRDSTAPSGWYGPGEDNEVEYPSLTGQKWDLEVVDLAGTTLTLWGGFDFQNGATDNSGRTWKPGDIFVDVNGDAIYGKPGVGAPINSVVKNQWGYDYVIDIEGGSATIRRIDANTMVHTAYFAVNEPSNPWRYESGALADIATVSVTYGSAIGGAAYDGSLLGAGGNDTHYSMSIDLAALFAQIPTDFPSWDGSKLFHYTYECGNDTIIGAPDGGMTVMLLGIALAGLGAFGLRRRQA